MARPVGSTPVVANDTVYVGSADGQVYAFDLATGTVQWTDGAGTRAPVAARPAVAGDRVLLADTGGTFHVLNGTGGGVVTTVALGTPIRTAPVTVGDTAYLGGRDGTVFALANATG